jgi:hypothetical protein
MRLALGFLAVVAIGACSGPSLPPPLEGVAPVASSSPAAPSSAASGPPSSGGIPVPDGFSEAEAALLASLRLDAQVGCAPRRENLPDKATAGVECAVGSDLVERVGVYGFVTAEEALAAYIARLAGYHVALRSGDCQAGTAGDRAWTPGDGPAEGGDLPSRIGCFLDENGTANVRVVCGTSGDPGPVRYIGILGAGSDLAALDAWAEHYPEGAEMAVPTPPGICFNDALQAPD